MKRSSRLDHAAAAGVGVAEQPSDPGAPVVTIRDLRRAFLTKKDRVVEAVAGVDLEVGRGEVLAVIGPSGCGKSTILRVLAGLDTEYEGDVHWNMAPTEGLQSATVFQQESTLPWLNVRQNVRLGMASMRQLAPAKANARAEHYISLVGLSEFASAYPHELSGGMRQRVAIARALATEPVVMLMDEPLAALDAQTRLVMQQELLDIWRRDDHNSSTAIYVTHDLEEALTLADRVVVMSARPSRIRHIEHVDFGRAREAVELRTRKEFHEKVRTLWRIIAEEVGRSLHAQPKEK